MATSIVNNHKIIPLAPHESSRDISFKEVHDVVGGKKYSKIEILFQKFLDFFYGTDKASALKYLTDICDHNQSINTRLSSLDRLVNLLPEQYKNHLLINVDCEFNVDTQALDIVYDLNFIDREGISTKVNIHVDDVRQNDASIIETLNEKLPKGNYSTSTLVAISKFLGIEEQHSKFLISVPQSKRPEALELLKVIANKNDDQSLAFRLMAINQLGKVVENNLNARSPRAEAKCTFDDHQQAMNLSYYFNLDEAVHDPLEISLSIDRADYNQSNLLNLINHGWIEAENRAPSYSAISKFLDLPEGCGEFIMQRLAGTRVSIADVLKLINDDTLSSKARAKAADALIAFFQPNAEKRIAYDIDYQRDDASNQLNAVHTLYLKNAQGSVVGTLNFNEVIAANDREAEAVLVEKLADNKVTFENKLVLFAFLRQSSNFQDATTCHADKFENVQVTHYKLLDKGQRPVFNMSTFHVRFDEMYGHDRRKLGKLNGDLHRLKRDEVKQQFSLDVDRVKLLLNNEPVVGDVIAQQYAVNKGVQSGISQTTFAMLYDLFGKTAGFTPYQVVGGGMEKSKISITDDGTAKPIKLHSSRVNDLAFVQHNATANHGFDDFVKESSEMMELVRYCKKEFTASIESGKITIDTCSLLFACQEKDACFEEIFKHTPTVKRGGW